MDKLKLSGIFTAGLLAFQAVALANFPARAEEFDGNDLRDIRLGMAATELEESGYVDLYCAADPKRMLAGWKNWRDCPADASGVRAIRFGYDPSTSRNGTMVAGHAVAFHLIVAAAHEERHPRARPPAADGFNDLIPRQLGLAQRQRIAAIAAAAIAVPFVAAHAIGLAEHCLAGIGRI